ncbi:MAG: TetR/AcrR family transcriptional regulator [Erysipelotrichaceae bacterium]|nr:TetR/AcrR family transcriptional regulator [Erysipelotrichaceae bacterium]MDY5252406.1 TetR/AcrR family transcriptional regulator [Erysipelotrichaceae bacterium]
MKKQEKTLETKRRIMAGALKEFGTNSYESSSINAICQDNHISKGLMYHNFKNKDELYLACVKASYDELLAYLQQKMAGVSQVELETFISYRQQFFEANPNYANIFFAALLQPPVHLAVMIKELRKPFDDYCMTYFRSCLRSLPLKKDLNEDIVLDYLVIFQEAFNRYFYQHLSDDKDHKQVIMDHETYLLKIVDIMLYGIVEKGSD